MFRITAPSEDELRHFLSRQKDSRFSYDLVGASARSIPCSYNIDHNRVCLGMGEGTWQRAVEAVREWKMFAMPWVRLCWRTSPIQAGNGVAVVVRHFGFYSLNACRIVYVIDEDGPIRRFGLAYGTLTGHAESGEERFTVEWNRDTGEVWYDILAFSQPRHALAKLGYPLSRYLQRKFARDSMKAMLRFIHGAE